MPAAALALSDLTRKSPLSGDDLSGGPPGARWASHPEGGGAVGH